jgi:tetratricopeptide (TPR) repeat protein
MARQRPLKRSPGLAAIGCGFALALSLGAVARAQAPSAAEVDAALQSSEYKELVRNAVQEYSLGNWAEARVFFAKAHALAPNARTLRGLALVCYESRRYVEFLGYAQRALASEIQPLTPAMQKELRQFLDQAGSFVARAHISLQPPGAELRVDGQPALRAEDGAILLDPGEHELIASAAGYQTHTRALDVQQAAEFRFEIALAPELAAGAQPIREPPLAAASGSGGSTVPWIVVSVSAAVAIGGGVLLGVASADKAKVESIGRDTPWSEVRDSYERAPTLFALGWTLLGVGVAGAATGLTWKLWLEPNAERPASAQLRFAPGAVALSGAF